MDVYDKWVDGLTLEQLREELKRLQVRYVERGYAMQDSGTMVRSLFVCSTCGNKKRDIGEKLCHCAKGIK